MENKEKNCEYKNRIADYADGLLEEAEAKDVKEHIDLCGECSAEYKAYTEFCGMMAECVRPVPEELHGKIMGAVRREARRARLMRAIKRYAAPVAAALVLALTVPAILRSNNGDMTEGTPTYHDAATEDGIVYPAADGFKYDGDGKSRSGDATDAAADLIATNSESDEEARDTAKEDRAPADTEPGVAEAPTADSAGGESFYQYTTSYSVSGEGVAVCYNCPIVEVEEKALQRLISNFSEYVKLTDDKGALFVVNDEVLEQLKLLGCDTENAAKADFVRVNGK
ncbi:MAG: zf-HC2 domain-containing protein [Ruminococcaceae bacterium]|nr:zf-HC2 domain-containing protein [Oscillospiraceae bacterium]